MVIPSRHDFSGRSAIVTGSGTGIDLATARQFALCGASVVFASRGAEELERSAAALRESTGAQCLAVPTDVKDEERVAQLIQRTIDEFGRIDILVNNSVNGGPTMGGIPDE